jgi:DNA-nicking Smr family endonuclease
LHGLTPAQALRRLRAEVHTCRVRGDGALVVITGQGFGNKLQQPVLRTQVEAWLDGPEAKALGVLSWTRVHRGGALEVQLARVGERDGR